MALSPEDIYVSFRGWIKNSSLTWGTSRKVWTRRIKEFFSSMGVKKGYRCYPSSNEPEYILDHVWMLEKPSRIFELGMEVELSLTTKNCLRAFRKLVDTKCYNKIGIFRISMRQLREKDLLKRMVEEVRQHRWAFANERYLVFFLSFDKRKNEIEMSGYEITNTGKTTDLDSKNVLYV